MTVANVPGPLAEIIAEFGAVTERQRLELLLDFSRDLPALPERIAAEPAAMEAVAECQSPLFLLVEVDPPADDDAVVHLYFDAPAEAPTTRGFAGVLHEGLDGRTVHEILTLPDDVALRLGISSVVSPLRLNGMAAMLFRIKRQIREKSTGPAEVLP